MKSVLDSQLVGNGPAPGVRPAMDALRLFLIAVLAAALAVILLLSGCAAEPAPRVLSSPLSRWHVEVAHTRAARNSAWLAWADAEADYQRARTH